MDSKEKLGLTRKEKIDQKKPMGETEKTQRPVGRSRKATGDCPGKFTTKV